MNRITNWQDIFKIFLTTILQKNTHLWCSKRTNNFISYNALKFLILHPIRGTTHPPRKMVEDELKKIPDQKVRRIAADYIAQIENGKKRFQVLREDLWAI